ncbi:hypothetical protein [Streptomyces europaeiscabiei]|uniref:hypothetical protein n=1 Tax=Streptomyces europaeiscabiei TaxID=146819 RepID=UPI0029C00453|nr:hypothetical protein [Streptomyces europaeiscabiei]
MTAPNAPCPYQHLGEEFERRLRALQDAGEVPDPRSAQIERLRAEVARLKERVAARDTALRELEAFRVQAVSRLAAQHEEITRLRSQVTQVSEAGNVRGITGAGNRTAPFGS